MAEYIEREAAIKRICEILTPVDGDDDGFLIDLFNKGLPAADVVPVVRCKDCDSYSKSEGLCKAFEIYQDENGYCSYGERMDGDGE